MWLIERSYFVRSLSEERGLLLQEGGRDGYGATGQDKSKLPYL